MLPITDYVVTDHGSPITDLALPITDHTLPIADRDTRESPVREMVKELKEFGIDVFGYDPLLSKEEIEGFGVNALDNLDVKIDCVIVAVAHYEFKNNPFLAQVLSLERKCILMCNDIKLNIEVKR